ncbi:hypothetical protein SUGI_0466380 [Cryptomeria japonica]|nr:hypothetical protein SUGI_0466380 [Cryptomeria japonica]
MESCLILVSALTFGIVMKLKEGAIILAPPKHNSLTHLQDMDRYPKDNYDKSSDINECNHIIGQSMCVGTEEGGMCHNLAGSYNCSCAKGYVGDGFTYGTGYKSWSSNRLVFLAIIGVKDLRKQNILFAKSFLRRLHKSRGFREQYPDFLAGALFTVT